MIEESGISKSFKKNFILDEGKLSKIVDIIKNHATGLTFDTYIKYRVSLKDNTYYETKDIEDVSHNDNTKDNPITRLVIMLIREKKEGEVTTASVLVSIDFTLIDNIWNDEKVSFSIVGENKEGCLLLANELRTQINRTQTQYIPSFFLKFEFDVIAGFLILIILFTLGAFYVRSNVQSLTAAAIAKMSIDERTQKILAFLQQQNDRSSINPWDVPLIFLLFGGVISIFTLRPFSRLFGLLDRSFFEWGDMKEISKKYQRKVRYIVLSVLGGLIISFVAGIGLHYLFK